uniref:Flavin-containing monooxygenase n=1 Tax=Rhizophora mucronata TaxID=61149 RepID=A0A2P2M771_RHIMU
MPTALSQNISRRVAVIGAGAAGLIASRELRREGHSVVVFERDNQVGGTWVYNPQVEPDPLSLDPNRPVIHSSLYKSLRTNLPREAMGFKDFPFIAKNDKERDPRRFPGHREVLRYLQEFATEFEIEEMVRFETEVVQVGFLEDEKKWKVRFKKKGCDDDAEEEIHDAIVVCNGHFTEPRVAEIPGKQLHSHNYRDPEPLQDQVVILIGFSSSGFDISKEISGVAKEVHVVSRSVADETYEKQPGYDNMWLHSMIEFAHKDGHVVFRNGRVVRADIILHCTGYKYHFPFLQTNGLVTVDDNRVGPIYKDVFPPIFAPSLSFVGLPWKVLPFPLFEFQSKWIAGVLSGRIVLPSQEEMMEDIEAFYLALEASNIPKRYTHNKGHSWLEYYNWLADQIGCPGVEEWREQMFAATIERRLNHLETYRDEWDDDALISEANADFSKYISNRISGGCTSRYNS